MNLQVQDFYWSDKTADLYSLVPVCQQVVGLATIISNIAKAIFHYLKGMDTVPDIENIKLGAARMIPIYGTYISLKRLNNLEDFERIPEEKKKKVESPTVATIKNPVPHPTMQQALKVLRAVEPFYPKLAIADTVITGTINMITGTNN